MKAAIQRMQALLVGVIFLLLQGNACATLIGDEVLAEIRFPTIDSHPFGSVSTIVTEGDDDILIPTPSLRVNVGADNILINFQPVNFSCFPPCEFNGLVVYDLDWVGHPTWGISQVDIETNLLGFTLDRLTFGADFVALDFNNLVCPLGQCTDVFLNARLTPSDIPEPSSLLLLALGLGILIVGGPKAWRRSPAAAIAHRPRK